MMIEWHMMSCDENFSFIHEFSKLLTCLDQWTEFWIAAERNFMYYWFYWPKKVTALLFVFFAFCVWDSTAAASWILVKASRRLLLLRLGFTFFWRSGFLWYLRRFQIFPIFSSRLTVCKCRLGFFFCEVFTCHRFSFFGQNVGIGCNFFFSRFFSRWIIVLWAFSTGLKYISKPDRTSVELCLACQTFFRAFPFWLAEISFIEEPEMEG